jgi:hypothetical protein
MVRNGKSVLDEINSFIPERHRDRVIEVRATNAIAAAINAIDLFEQTYTTEEVEDLTKKFLLAIKTKESKKFTNKLRSLTESRNK